MTALLLVAAPLLAASILLLIGSRGPRAVAAVIAVAAPAFGFGAALAVAQALSSGREAISVDLGQWLPLRGADVALRVEPWAAPLLVALTGAATVMAVLALRDTPREIHTRFFVPFELLLAGAVGVVTAANLVMLLVAWGVAGTAGAQLARARDASAASARDGASALVIARLGDACLLLATFALLTLVQTVDLVELGGRIGGVPLVPTAERVVLATSVLMAVAVASRAGLLPFTPWLPSPRGPRSALLTLSLGMGLGAVLLVRVLPLLDDTVVTILGWLGAATAIVMSAVSLARPRESGSLAAAEIGTAVAAVAVDPTAGIAVVIASQLAGVVAVSVPRSWRADVDATVIVLLLAVVLTTGAPAVAAALAVAAVVAGLATLFGSETGRPASLAARAGDPAGLVARSFAAAADTVERGGDGLLDAVAIGGARVTSWTTRRARALADASEWMSAAVLVAGAIAIVVFWATR